MERGLQSAEETGKTITPEDRERLAELIADVRSLTAIADRLTKLAEDITGDYDDMNSHTFDVCNNSKEVTVDELLSRLGIAVAATDSITSDSPATTSSASPTA